MKKSQITARLAEYMLECMNNSGGVKSCIVDRESIRAVEHMYVLCGAFDFDIEKPQHL